MDIDVSCTPPEVAARAKVVPLDLLLEKSRDVHESVYNNFVKWRKDNGIANLFSENVLLTYFNDISKRINLVRYGRN